MLEQLKENWEKILDNVKEDQDLSDVSFNTWLVPLKPVSVEGNVVTILCPVNSIGLEYIDKKYKIFIQVAIEEVIGFKCELHLVIPEEKAKKAPKKKVVDADIIKANLNPRYTFDTFVVGSNNKMAHAASLAVAESPAEIYNPLFIYGGVGLGKTHLMHAIGHHILKNRPEMKVLYVSSEMFTSELIKALHDNKNGNAKMRVFKNKYRTADVLLIDDIQFIEGKESTQMEFFHTFNTLHDYNKQIVISTDRHPSHLRDLDERLRSRFQWNIVADIQPPDFETRVAILRKKAEVEGVEIDDDVLDVIDLIAEKVKFNIRELESALTRIVSYSTLFNKKITVKFARKNLNDIFSAGDFDLTCETIKKAVARKYGVKITDLESAKRKREFSHPRQVAMYLCRELTDSSLPKISEYFGGRDHTTVLHAYDKISSEIKTSNILEEEIRILKNELQ